MVILKRNEISSYPPSIVQDGSSPIGLTEVKKDDPSSTYFEYPDWLLPLNAPKLVSWLKECHENAELQFIEPYKRHLKQAKKLVDSYGHDDLIRATKRAAQLAKHPFSFKFVEKILNDDTQHGLVCN